MPINNTMMQFIQLVRRQGNPQQFLLSMLEQQDNPLSQNILNLAKNNKQGEIEMIARNMFKERGLDFDKEFNSFKQMLGL